MRTTPASAVEALGYSAVAPPSTAFGPGYLVTTVKGTGFVSPLKLTYLCNPEFTTVPPPVVDAAASSAASSAFGGGFVADASLVNELGLGASAEFVESITLEFDNVRIEQLGFDDLEQIRRDLGEGCKAIVARFADQAIAYQTKQAIRADVTYTANIKRGASAEVKNAIIGALGARFGGSVQGGDDTSITGRGLYYGLVLETVAPG